MDKVTDLSSLNARISFLEQKRDYDKEVIVSTFHEFLESLKPANMLRHLITSIRESHEMKTDIMHGLVGLGTGFLTNKLLLSSFHGPIKRIIATVIQAGITNAAVKYPEQIKEKSISVLTRILQAMKFKTDDDQPNAVTATADL